MLLNSHTFIRSFRELQYDLHVFLEAVSRVCPLESSTEGIVEIKWSDGSVSVAPIQSLVTAYVGGKFPKLDIGDSSIVPEFKEGGIDLRIDSDTGVSLKFDTLDADSLKVISTAITKLVVTTDTSIAPDVLINRLDVSGDVTAKFANILRKTTVTNQLMMDSMVAGRLDISDITCYPKHFVSPQRVEQSSYVYTYSKEPVFNDKLIVSGPVCFNYETPMGVQSLFNNLDIQYYIPGKPYDNYLLWESDTYERHNVAFTVPITESLGFNEPLANMSIADLVCIYPRKRVYINPILPYKYNVMVDVPSDDDAGKIVQVCNPTSTHRKVCNAWRFYGDKSTMPPKGKVITQYWVTLPPHSCIDFLFDFEKISESLYAYMLPMSALE